MQGLLYSIRGNYQKAIDYYEEANPITDGDATDLQERKIFVYHKLEDYQWKALKEIQVMEEFGKMNPELMEYKAYAQEREKQ